MINLLRCRCLDKWRDAAPFILRVVVGVIFVMHGYQKFADIGVAQFGGFLDSLGVPAAGLFAIIVTAVEFFGGIALILGIFVHIAAKLLAFDMLMAILLLHFKNGFFIQNNGYEFVLLLFSSLIVILIIGPGKWALERKFFKG